MRCTIYGKNMEITDSLRQQINTKFSKLDKFFTPDTEAHITLSTKRGEDKVEAMISIKGKLLRAERSNKDMYVAIDKVVDVLERMIRKYKTKISHTGKGTGGFTESFMDEDIEVPESIQITKSKRFAIKPMDIEEACIQMELIGHTFYMFRNSTTFEINVVYKREDGTYGLIEPEF